MGFLIRDVIFISGKMSEVESLDDLQVWAADGENMCTFLDDVLDILHSNPNKFVTIKEIAKKRNWQFKEYAGWVLLLCFPINNLPEIEMREDEDYAMWAFKYDPNTHPTDRDIDFWCEIYGESIDKVIDDFKEIKRETDLKKSDELLEETLRQLNKTQRDEWASKRGG